MNAGPPSTLLAGLRLLPPDTGVALLLRHSCRPPFIEGQDGSHVALTEEGIIRAEILGQELGGRLHRVYTSPLLRCRQTAEALIRDAGTDCEVVPHHLLGDPGPFVIDSGSAWPIFLAHSPLEVAIRQLTEPSPLPGMRPTREGVSLVLNHLLDPYTPPGRITVHVTHDIILALTVAFLLDEPIEANSWPEFLEGLLVWRNGDSLYRIWRGRVKEGRSPISLRGNLC